MYTYIDRLLMCGFNRVEAFRVCVSFGRENDFDGLDGYIKVMEARRKAEQYDVKTPI